MPLPPHDMQPTRRAGDSGIENSAEPDDAADGAPARSAQEVLPGDGSRSEAGSGTDSEAGGDADAVLQALDEGRRHFLALVGPLRPELLRYCARMTGSVLDGEDVVQDTLASACFELAQMTAVPQLRPWLFRIAHNRAVDHWRHERHRASEPLEAADELASDAALEPDNALARQQAIGAAIACFLALAPAQRGAVVLKDVLGHTLDEIAVELGLTLPAVKAALHRGRAALQRIVAEGGAARAVSTASTSMQLRRYAALFNARDWDAVRALLADDVRLDLVSQRKAAGKRDVGVYFGNYARLRGWRVAPAWLDGREVLVVFTEAGATKPRYAIALTWADGRVASIRDFRYVPAVVDEGRLIVEPEAP